MVRTGLPPPGRPFLFRAGMSIPFLSSPLISYLCTHFRMAMSAKYTEFSGLNLPAFEKEMLANWTENHAFEKSVNFQTTLYMASSDNKHRFLHQNEAHEGTFSLHIVKV